MPCLNIRPQTSCIRFRLHFAKPYFSKLRTISHKTADTTPKMGHSSEGLPAEDLEEPLPPEMHKDIMKVSQDFYRVLRYDPRRICTDGQFARFRREFQAWQPSAFQVLRVRTLAFALKTQQRKSHKVSDTLTVSFAGGDEFEDDAAAGDLYLFLSRLDVLSLTWGVVGCYDVTYQSATCKFCHASEASQYYYEFHFKAGDLRARFTDQSIHVYLTVVEEAFRGKAVEFTRSADKIPWGQGSPQGLPRGTRSLAIRKRPSCPETAAAYRGRSVHAACSEWQRRRQEWQEH